MYVVRPQFYPVGSVLGNAAFNSLKYKTRIGLGSRANIDIGYFEEDLDAFKVALPKTGQLCFDQLCKQSMKSISASSKRWRKLKKFLTTSENQRLANTLEDVSVKIDRKTQL